MPAKPAKAKPNKARKPAAAAKLKVKVLHKKALPAKRKSVVKSKAQAKSRPLARPRPLAKKAKAKQQVSAKAKPAAKALTSRVSAARGKLAFKTVKPPVKPAAKLLLKNAPAPVLSKAEAKLAAKVAAKLAAKGKLGKPDNAAVPKPQTAKEAARQIAKQQAAKYSAKHRQDLKNRAEQRPEDVEARRSRLKNLIKLGKERGFLTYAEVNDHLPDDMVDAEQIESIITTFGDMGIQVYDVAPDAETLLISENAPAVVPDEDAEEEAEAALSTVDPEFGRTTDPVRMYMREMGSVELLTREGEIEIAKRIEDGLKHMIHAISACPTTIAEILALAGRVARDEMRIDELVDGLIDPNAGTEPIAELVEEEIEEEEEEELDEEEQNAAITASLLQLKDTVKLPMAVRNGIPSSLNGMATDNPFMLALADIPVAPGIKANSIIAIQGDDEPPAGADGVVKYTSAHVDYAESEFIVRSGHSCQGNPLTIEEVRRILLENLGASK